MAVLVNAWLLCSPFLGHLRGHFTDKETEAQGDRVTLAELRIQSSGLRAHGCCLSTESTMMNPTALRSSQASKKAGCCNFNHIFPVLHP